MTAHHIISWLNVHTHSCALTKILKTLLYSTTSGQKLFLSTFKMMKMFDVYIRLVLDNYF